MERQSHISRNPVVDAYNRFRISAPELDEPVNLVQLYQNGEIYDALVEFTEIRTENEVDFIHDILKHYRAEKVLDIACGTGRHAIPLSRRGYNVFGLDYSYRQIIRIAKKTSEKETQPNIICADANILPFTENSIDASYCMLSTLGEEPLRYNEVIENTLRVLKPGGIFIIDNWNWPQKKGEPEVHREKSKRCDPEITWYMTTRFDLEKKLRVRVTRYQVGERKYKYVCITHTFNTQDWIREFEKAGFAPVEIYHDYIKHLDARSAEATNDSVNRIQIVFQKPLLDR